MSQPTWIKPILKRLAVYAIVFVTGVAVMSAFWSFSEAIQTFVPILAGVCVADFVIWIWHKRVSRKQQSERVD